MEAEHTSQADHDIVLKLQAKPLHESTEVTCRVTREVKGQDGVIAEELSIHGKKVFLKQGCFPRTTVSKTSFSSEFPVEQAFWCQFDGESGGSKLDCVCIVDFENITLYSDTGNVFHVAVPFKLRKVWPIAGGLLIERQVSLLPPASSSLSGTFSTEDGLPVLFTLTHPLDDICPVVSQGSSECNFNYVYNPQLSVVATFTDPSLVVTFDAALGCHAVWRLRDTEADDIPMQLPSMCRNLSSFVAQQTPQVLSSSAPEKYHMFAKGTPIMTPVQRLLFLSPGIFSPGGVAGQGGDSPRSPPNLPGSGGGRMDQAPSVRNPLIDHLSSSNKVAQRLKSAVRIGSGRTPLKMRFNRFTQDIDRELLNERKAKSYSPVRSSPLLPHYSRSWSTVFCDPVVSDVSILDSMGDPLLPEKCMERLWLGDQNFSDASCPADAVLHTRDASGGAYLVLVLGSAGRLRLLRYSLAEGGSRVDAVRLFGQVEGSIAVSVAELNMIVVKGKEDLLRLYSGTTLVGRLCVCDESNKPVQGIVKMTSSSGRQIVFQLSTGATASFELPPLASSDLVLLCLRALQAVLPCAVAEGIVHALYLWNGQSDPSVRGREWNVFSRWLLTALRIPQQSAAGPSAAVCRAVAEVPVLRMFATNPALEALSARMRGGGTSGGGSTQSRAPTTPPLLHIARELFTTLYLVYEELKLNIACSEDANKLRTLLYTISKWFGWAAYVDLCFRDCPEVHQECWALQSAAAGGSAGIQPPLPPVCFVAWLRALLEGDKVAPYPVIPTVTTRLCTVAKLYALRLGAPASVVSVEEALLSAGHKDSREVNTFCLNEKKDFEELQVTFHSPAERVVSWLAREGTSAADLLQTLPCGVGLLVLDCLIACRHQPSPKWTPHINRVIGRDDIARSSKSDSGATLSTITDVEAGEGEGEIDGMGMDRETLKHMFTDDLRVGEVRKCLCSSKPVKIALEQKPEVSDHDFLEKQEEYLLLLTQRTMALPVARGMFTLGTVQPVPVRHFPTPELNLTGRTQAKNASITFDRISVPDNMTDWPSFHNGVASGLRITPHLSKVDSTWVMCNIQVKDQSTSITDAGFLMGLGLNGLLKELPEVDLCNLLSQRSALCTIGLLLGMSASSCGSCDPRLSTLVGLHIRSLLPPGSADMDIPHFVEIASLVSLGLLHMGSANRHFTDTMLREIACEPGPEMEDAVDRESHSLAAGLSLGMLTLGLGGSSPNLTDLRLLDRLMVYIKGGAKSLVMDKSEHRKGPSQLIMEGETVNTHITAPGAILALGLAYIKTNLQEVAGCVAVPSRYSGILKIRPDFLLLRVLAYRLILWDSIEPTLEWVLNHLPTVVCQWAFCAGDTPAGLDIEALSQAQINIVAGACFVLGLKYAGTASKEANAVLMYFVHDFLSIRRATAKLEMVGRPCMYRCLCLVLTSAAMVMSGTGDLEVFRVVRYLRDAVSCDLTYGHYMSLHMALGLVYQGGCRQALCSSSRAVACLLAAFYPIYPTSSTCNRYHLQAFRHLYVLATSSRVLLARNVDTGSITSVPVTINVQNKSGEFEPHQMTLPGVVTSWESIARIEVIGERCWNFVLEITPELRQRLARSGTIYVKERIGYFSFEDDPGGQQSSLSKALISGYKDHSAFFTIGHGFVDIHELSKNLFVKTFASSVCQPAAKQGEKEARLQRYYHAALTECVLGDKLDLLPCYVAISKLSEDLERGRWCDLSQFGLMLAYSRFCARRGKESVLSCQFLSSQESKLKLLLEEGESSLGSGMKSLLSRYLVEGCPGPCSPPEAILLGTCLAMYSIPPPHLLSIAQNASCLEVYRALKSAGCCDDAILKVLPLFTDNLLLSLSQISQT